MKLIIDTDPGVDDAIAIALAHALPQIDLVGLTTVFGNTFVAQSSRNARYLADLLGADVPVAQGAALPWGAESYVPSANVHGPEGFGEIDVVPEIGRNIDETAAEFLVRMAHEHKGELVVCAIGPLTNIADALKLDPEFAQNLGQLVIMGGAFEAPGNITPHAEANIYHDAAAADFVFASGLSLIMVGLNATLQTLLTPEEFAELGQASQKVGGFLEEISHFYLSFYRSVGITEGCPMHDALAVLACVHPEKFTLVEAGLRVPVDGDDLGATLKDDSRPKVQIAMGVEAAWATGLMKQSISAL